MLLVVHNEAFLKFYPPDIEKSWLQEFLKIMKIEAESLRIIQQ